MTPLGQILPTLRTLYNFSSRWASSVYSWNKLDSEIRLGAHIRGYTFLNTL